MVAHVSSTWTRGGTSRAKRAGEKGKTGGTRGHGARPAPPTGPFLARTIDRFVRLPAVGGRGGADRSRPRRLRGTGIQDGDRGAVNGGFSAEN